MNVVVPLDRERQRDLVQDVGDLAATCWPSISAGTTGSVPQASSVDAVARAATRWAPVIGSNESWSMIERRTRRPLLGLVIGLEPSQFMRADDRLRQRDAVEVRVGRDREVDVDRRARPGCPRAWRRPSRARAPGDSSARSERLVTVPLIRPSTSRSAAVDVGARGAAPRRGSCAASRTRPRGRGRATGRPGARRGRRRCRRRTCRRSSASPAGRRPSTRSWKVARDGAEDAEVGLGRRRVGARRAADDRDLVDDDVRAAQQRPDPERRRP